MIIYVKSSLCKLTSDAFLLRIKTVGYLIDVDTRTLWMISKDDS